MYYKVVKDGNVIDVLDQILYVKYQKKHDRMLLCEEREAQAFLSSDGETAWHDVTLLPLPSEASRYDTVERVEIDAYEYNRLKALSGKTPEEIIDAYTLALIEEGML